MINLNEKLDKIFMKKLFVKKRRTFLAIYGKCLFMKRKIDGSLYAFLDIYVMIIIMSPFKLVTCHFLNFPSNFQF